MKVSYDGPNRNGIEFEDLPIGATFIRKFVIGTTDPEADDTAAVYIKLKLVRNCETDHKYNCINLGAGKLVYLTDPIEVIPIDADVKWRYQE